VVAVVSGSNVSAVTMHAVMFRPLTAMLDELAGRLSEASEELSTVRVTVERLIKERNAGTEVVRLLLDGCLPAVARDGTRVWAALADPTEPVALLTDQHWAILEAAQQM
jgi:hypothetical protein